MHHLPFADDFIIFSTGKGAAIKEVIQILKDYESQSGQMINFLKTAFYMHSKVETRVIERIKRWTKCTNRTFSFTYLGCPVYLGRKKVELFDKVITKVVGKCKGWSSKLLSVSVLQAVPAYLFADFNPPKAVIKKQEGLFADFLWGFVGNKAKYHWSSWKILAKPVNEGGVGFCGFEEMVFAASAKLWWEFRGGIQYDINFLGLSIAKRHILLQKDGNINTLKYGEG